MNLKTDLEPDNRVFKSWFEAIDSDRDNKISKEELLEYMHKYLHPYKKDHSTK
jgi:hypothetical protein